MFRSLAIFLALTSPLTAIPTAISKRELGFPPTFQSLTLTPVPSNGDTTPIPQEDLYSAALSALLTIAFNDDPTILQHDFAWGECTINVTLPSPPTDPATERSYLLWTLLRTVEAFGTPTTGAQSLAYANTNLTVTGSVGDGAVAVARREKQVQPFASTNVAGRSLPPSQLSEPSPQKLRARQALAVNATEVLESAIDQYEPSWGGDEAVITQRDYYLAIARLIVKVANFPNRDVVIEGVDGSAEGDRISVKAVDVPGRPNVLTGEGVLNVLAKAYKGSLGREKKTRLALAVTWTQGSVAGDESVTGGVVEGTVLAKWAFLLEAPA